MARFPRGFWGPKPVWAVAPLAVVTLLVAWLVGGTPANGPVAVTALKPVVATISEAGSGEGDDSEHVPEMPIEVRYGVPAPRSIGLWSPPSRR